MDGRCGHKYFAQLEEISRRHLPIEIVLQWIDKAWSNVAEDLINRAFVKCGIANAIDGSEERELLENLGDHSEDISDESGC